MPKLEHNIIVCIQGVIFCDSSEVYILDTLKIIILIVNLSLNFYF